MLMINNMTVDNQKYLYNKKQLVQVVTKCKK